MNIDESKSVPSDNAAQTLVLEDYDLVILGGGTGATIAAWTFGSQGQRVAVI
jgi:ribulose 1,5-bisphosphate synthetase/thiazole synthase